MAQTEVVYDFILPVNTGASVETITREARRMASELLGPDADLSVTVTGRKGAWEVRATAVVVVE